jgi:hypothetical protein
MELFETLKKVTLDSYRIHHLVAIFSLVYVILKISKLIVKRNEWIRALETFPGPPKHWLFGHVREVMLGSNENFFNVHIE